MSGRKEGVAMEGHTDVPCPNCNNPVNDRPRAGDVTVCLNCGAWLVPDGDSKLRGMSRSEAEQMPGPVQSTLIKASRLILQRGGAAPAEATEEDHERGETPQPRTHGRSCRRRARCRQ